MAQGSRLKAWSASGLAAALTCVAPLVLAQGSFDVASVKESTSFETGGSLRLMPDGGVRAQNVPLRSLITIAYQLQPYQLVNVPGWASDTRYNVEAKPAASVPRAQIFPMLQALLAERFALAIRRESRQVDGFVLTRVRADRLGPELKPSELNCEKDMATVPKCRQGGITADTMTVFGAPVWNLLQLLIAKAGAPVTDETGLTGTYDMQLRWSDDVAPGDDRQSIYTAVQEQLGLKLERRRVTTEVVVIERVERATPD